MFFFFIGGVEPAVGRVLKEAAGRCVRCGGRADLVEAQKVLKLFFVPVWRWQARDPMFYCRDCSFLFPHSLPAAGGEEGPQERDAAYFPRISRAGAVPEASIPRSGSAPTAAPLSEEALL